MRESEKKGRRANIIKVAPSFLGFHHMECRGGECTKHQVNINKL